MKLYYRDTQIMLQILKSNEIIILEPMVGVDPSILTLLNICCWLFGSFVGGASIHMIKGGTCCRYKFDSSVFPMRGVHNRYTYVVMQQSGANLEGLQTNFEHLSLIGWSLVRPFS